MDDGNQEKLLKGYDLLVRTSPGNRPARLLRMALLIRVGRIEEAKSELEYLRTKCPDFPSVYENEVRLWHVLGNKNMELEACKRILKRKHADTLAAQLAKITARFTEARVAEMKGQPGRAESMLKAIVSKSDPKMVSFKRSMLGGFYLRQGNWVKAIEILESAVDPARKHKLSGDSEANVRIKIATALWVTKKRQNALKIALGAAELQLSRRRSSHEFLARAVLTGYVLTRVGVGSETDKKKARLLLQKAAKRFPVGRLYSVESVALVLTGKLPRNETIDRVKNVLKAAPHLDWALWAALYLGLSEPEHAKDLLKLLPEKSLQRRIAEVEQKAAATTQTTTPANAR